MQRLFFSITVGFLIGACATTEPATPVEVVNNYIGALKSGDKEQRDRWVVSKGQGKGFTQVLGSPPKKLQAREVLRRFEWKQLDGTRLVVLSIKGERFLNGDIGPSTLLYPSNPGQTLRVFAYAVLGGHFGLLMRLLPTAEAKLWTAARLGHAIRSTRHLKAWVMLARRLLKEPIRLVCNEATAQCTVGLANPKAKITLKREGKLWKIVDVTPSTTYSPAP